ncbi:NUDIX hydrolase [Planctomonas sp. JC2975]|uniref:NUDIX domain-containing protein n=1 Tax=Planctomonas sp. JC2975 TaxID=2729626 RepID=UPI0014746D92|nr:NUDIX hydrolase [Planctomonas sp. JC2975]
MTDTVIYAGGAVCWRIVDGTPHILVVHRAKYGDVTLPKGKVDPGETLPQAAQREVLEETGLQIALGVPLGITNYVISSGREKFVHYWAAEVTERAVQASTFVPNDEIAAIEWVPLRRMRKYLSYKRDAEIVDQWAALYDEGVTKTFALIVLRHAKAAPRSGWKGADALRPLTKTGILQAASNVPTIAAWMPKRIITSTAVRCVATVAPLVAAYGIEPKRTAKLSQDLWEDGEAAAGIREVIGKRVRSRKTAVLCSHGPVIPDVLREIALATGTTTGSYIRDAAALEVGEYSVVHLSATNPSSGIIAIETHSPRD